MGMLSKKDAPAFVEAVLNAYYAEHGVQADALRAVHFDPVIEQKPVLQQTPPQAAPQHNIQATPTAPTPVPQPAHPVQDV